MSFFLVQCNFEVKKKIQLKVWKSLLFFNTFCKPFIFLAIDNSQSFHFVQLKLLYWLFSAINTGNDFSSIWFIYLSTFWELNWIFFLTSWRGFYALKRFVFRACIWLSKIKLLLKNSSVFYSFDIFLWSH